jgi:hypothetical protein
MEPHWTDVPLSGTTEDNSFDHRPLSRHRAAQCERPRARGSSCGDRLGMVLNPGVVPGCFPIGPRSRIPKIRSEVAAGGSADLGEPGFQPPQRGREGRGRGPWAMGPRARAMGHGPWGRGRGPRGRSLAACAGDSVDRRRHGIDRCVADSAVLVALGSTEEWRGRRGSAPPSYRRPASGGALLVLGACTRPTRSRSYGWGVDTVQFRPRHWPVPLRAPDQSCDRGSPHSMS